MENGVCRCKAENGCIGMQPMPINLQPVTATTGINVGSVRRPTKLKVRVERPEKVSIFYASKILTAATLAALADSRITTATATIAVVAAAETLCSMLATRPLRLSALLSLEQQTRTCSGQHVLLLPMSRLQQQQQQQPQGQQQQNKQASKRSGCCPPMPESCVGFMAAPLSRSCCSSGPELCAGRSPKSWQQH